MSSEAAVYLGLASGAAAVCLWLVIFGRTLLDLRHHRERRAPWVLMAGTALLASVGTLASAIGYGMQTGVIVLDIWQPTFSFIASHAGLLVELLLRLLRQVEHLRGLELHLEGRLEGADASGQLAVVAVAASAARPAHEQSPARTQALEKIVSSLRASRHRSPDADEHSQSGTAGAGGG